MAKKYLDDNGLSYLWGKIKATFALISHTHTVSNITDFPSTMTPSSHTHGNLSNGGALSSDVTVATGDKLVIVDSSNSSKVARASLSFDTATSGTDKKALTQAGTWQTFLTSADVPEGASASSTTPKMDGTATVGTETAFARGDHIHPSDTSRVPTTRTVNGHALSSNITLSASDVGALPDSTVIPSADDHKWNDVELSKVTTGFDSDTNARYIPILSATSGTTSTLIPTIVGNDSIIYQNLAYKIPRYSGAGYLFGFTASNDDSSAKLATTMFVKNIFSSKAGSANGICPLDSNGKVDSSYLPSFVDDVIEAYARSNQTELSSTWLATGSASGTVITPEAGKIYVLMNSSTNYDANSQFRWGGTAYVKLADGGVTAITNAEIDTIVAS